MNTTRVSNFFIETRVVSYSESLASQGFLFFAHDPEVGFDNERETRNCLAILGADEGYLSNQKTPLHYKSRAVRSAEGACLAFSGAGRDCE